MCKPPYKIDLPRYVRRCWLICSHFVLIYLQRVLLESLDELGPPDVQDQRYRVHVKYSTLFCDCSSHPIYLLLHRVVEVTVVAGET